MKKIGCAIIHVILLPVIVQAQTFTDDFSDPASFASNWVVLDSSYVLDESGNPVLGPDGQPTFREWGPGIVSLDSGALNMMTSNPVPLADPELFPPGDITVFDTPNVGAIQASATREPIRDVIVRSKVRVDTASNAAIGFRANLQTFSNYNVTAAGSVGKFSISRFEGGVMTRVEVFDEPTFAIGEDWWMEGSAIGNQISLKVWKDGTAEPDDVQFSWTDDSLSAGGVGLGAVVWNNNVNDPTILNATFDDFSYQVVPEPAAGLAMMWGLVLLACRRRAPLARFGR